MSYDLNIEQKIKRNQSLTKNDYIELYNYPLEILKNLANNKRILLHSQNVYYNKNVHLEPTNRCVYSCKFCSFYRTYKDEQAIGMWDYSIEDIEKILLKQTKDITEIHITGGVHLTHDINWFIKLFKQVKKVLPHVHIKALTAVEIDFIAKISKLSIKDTLQTLIDNGLGSLPGGGAEIFNKSVRKKIAGGKAPANKWLHIHETAHKLGISSNATMLFGHIESIEDRIDHMLDIKNLQNQHGGFNAFIPLKYRNENNKLSYLKETNDEDVFKTYAISRILFDNIKSIKTYWVMLGIDKALKSLDYGVDDFDGTVDNSTKIYSMAGSIDSPSLTEANLKEMLTKKGYKATERDSNYSII